MRMNSIDFGGHRSKLKVRMGIVDKCGVRSDATHCVVIPPATNLGGEILESPCPSVCRRARLGKIAQLGIGCRGGYFVPLGQPHSSYLYY